MGKTKVLCGHYGLQFFIDWGFGTLEDKEEKNRYIDFIGETKSIKIGQQTNHTGPIHHCP